MENANTANDDGNVVMNEALPGPVHEYNGPTTTPAEDANAAATRREGIVTSLAASLNGAIPITALRGLLEGIVRGHKAHVERGIFHSTTCYGCGFREDISDVRKEKRTCEEQLTVRTDELNATRAELLASQEKVAALSERLAELETEYSDLGALHTELGQKWRDAVTQMEVTRRTLAVRMRGVANMVYSGEGMPSFNDLIAPIASDVEVPVPGSDEWDPRNWKAYWVQLFRRNQLPPTLEWTVEYINGELTLAFDGQSARATVFMHHVADHRTQPAQYVAGLFLAVQPALYRAYVDGSGGVNYIREAGPTETYVMHQPLGFTATNLDPLMYAMTRGFIEEEFVRSLLYGCRIGWLQCIVNGPEELRPPGWEAVWAHIRNITPETPGDNRLRQYPGNWLPPAVHRRSLTAPAPLEAAVFQPAMGPSGRGRGRGRGHGFHPYARGNGRGGNPGRGGFAF
ncbi:hypothetical protein PENSPDRAFT_694937 [Peniophora sp. CONT]|nr:hypothetical protein PENSPDRAFT_694937 [Peniophora sp. CONT]